MAGAVQNDVGAHAADIKTWDTSYEWKAITLLTLGFGLVGLDRWILAPLDRKSVV